MDLETERLRLHCATREEMEGFIARQTDAALKAAYAEMLEGSLKKPGQREWNAIWMIALKDGRHAGELCFKGLSADGIAEIGYGIAPEHEGKGYATEAVRAATEWALSQPGAGRITAETDPGNVASRRVLEKSGFAATGEMGAEGMMYARGRRLAVNGREHEAVRLLGKGKGGISWLVKDGAGALRTLKQIHHEPCAYYQFGNKLEAELRDYRILKDAEVRVPELLETDAANERLLKEYVEGPTAAELVREGRLGEESLRQARELSARLRERGLNLDWYPTNFVVSGGELHYIDYECNAYCEEWSFERWGAAYWRGERALE